MYDIIRVADKQPISSCTSTDNEVYTMHSMMTWLHGELHEKQENKMTKVNILTLTITMNMKKMTTMTTMKVAMKNLKLQLANLSLLSS